MAVPKSIPREISTSAQVGEQVLYVLPDGRREGQSRPATVVFSFTDECPESGIVNLAVMTDGIADGLKYASGLLHVTAVPHRRDDLPTGCWYRAGEGVLA